MDYINLFHVHTKRCGHAGEEDDEKYIRKAIELGAASIYFTDLAPFPGNIFGNRMKIEDLDEYVNSLTMLKEKYKNLIDVKIGLEIEYIPKFTEYYKELKERYNLPLFLGQHICEHQGDYNFNYKDKSEEYLWMEESIVEALETEFFSAVFHPERGYRRVGHWGEEQAKSAERLWKEFEQRDINIEYNYSSARNKLLTKQFSEFWDNKTSPKIIYGIDAHSTKELEEGTLYFRNDFEHII